METKIKHWRAISLTLVFLLSALTSANQTLRLHNENTSDNRTLELYNQLTIVQDQNYQSQAANRTNNQSHQPQSENPSSSETLNRNSKRSSVSSCSSACTEAEFSAILQRLVQDNDILGRFKEIEQLIESEREPKIKLPANTDVKTICIRELIGLIKSLASNELEMKTIFEFVSDSSVPVNNYPLSMSKSYNRDSGSKGGDDQPMSKNSSDTVPDSRSLDLAQIKWIQSGALSFDKICKSDSDTRDLVDGHNVVTQIGSQPEETVQQDGAEKSRVLSKLVANIDHWINALEAFTLTREWSSLMKVFQGTEAVLDMFVNKTRAGSAKGSASKQALTTVKPAALNTSVLSIPESNNRGSQQSQVQKHDSTPDELIDSLRANLPNQVMIITTSLNSLFPWHVWPWNNLDLYSTIDTFLNHGIFAFSKTTVGPERRIDLLPELLQTLFKSLNYGSFPKKCNDWSKIICDQAAFHDRLVIPPPTDELTQDNLKEREEKVRSLLSVNKNILTQELTCIMFSSLSMQHFGANQTDLELLSGMSGQSSLPNLESSQTNRLAWDRQVQKALKLYTLAREALTDQQWSSLYGLINDLWARHKISDRVIMVSRVLQLLTNCHMPKEMLESALWKDIYKYKNVLNQLIDIVIEELNRSSESGKFQIEQISFGSPHLNEILVKFIKFSPKLIEALSQTVVDQLPELVNRLFSERIALFRAPCKGHSFSDIVPSLRQYRAEIVEIEELVCRQLKTRPNITMMQFNMLTNEFLAMAFNFSNFGNALAFPKLLTNLEPGPKPLVAPAAVASIAGAVITDATKVSRKDAVVSIEVDGKNSTNGSNVTSIIDEMAANPRLAPIVAILQSSALDPPEVHAVLPELDWVEAGTSIALLYESVQRLMSHEESFSIFPELEGFQDEMRSQIDLCQQMFKKFSKRDPIRLVAYSLDAAMPIALRTFKPLDSFNAECSSSFRDIFSEDFEGKVTRQWQCAVSSLNFASWATNNFMRTFNNMFRNILGQMSPQSVDGSTRSSPNRAVNYSGTHNTCIFFDGSVSMMLDNLPQFIDLVLETVLMASTNSDQQLTLYDIMCSSQYMLDPFNQGSIELKARMKDKMCHLFNKKSLTKCAEVLELDQWTLTMRELNSTWFEAQAISIAPSFRNITVNGHEFLKLFGQFKPSTMSDSLIAKVLNVNSFWTNLLNRIVGIIDKYQEKRFEYALQTLTPIIYDNLPTSTKTESSNDGDNVENLKEVRETLITTILGAKAVLNYLDNLSNATSAPANTSDRFESQIQSLFNWADQYSLISAEVLLKTMANNITKLETIFKPNESNRSDINSAKRHEKLTMSEIWTKFCSSPVDRYLDLQKYTIIETETTSNATNLTIDQMYIQMESGRESICKFQWQSFYDRLGADSNKILDHYPDRQLTRIALTKWGQVLDVMFIESKHIKQLPKFFYMDYWQHFRHKLPQISPLKDQPSNLAWIWGGLERIVIAMDAGSNQTSDSLVRILDQLNCGLDAVKGGLSWENIANIYQDKQDILAAHSTINNGFALASIGVNTLLAHRNFQRFLDEFVKPRVGLNAFCELRDRNHLESIFSIPSGANFMEALESFQELICDTNFETLAQNINPISICYQTSFAVQQSNGTKVSATTHPLADIMDRFFKLASLAILDAKLVAASDAKPPILDKNQWSTFWSWWSAKAEPQPKSGLTLTVVRVFQTIDSINSNHVVWKALFRSVHEISEVIAYLLRAVAKKHQEVDMIGAVSRLSLVKEAATQIDTVFKSNDTSKQNQQQQLASTLSNIMFPEVNNFISFRTFKQLRYIKTISDYFTNTVGAQESVCKLVAISATKQINSTDISKRNSRFDLIGYKLNTNEKLHSLLCHYHSTQWLTALNIIISTKTSSIPKKVNYMTKYLSIFIRNYKDNESLESFIHSQQLENIENVANTTVSYLLAASHSLKSLSFSKISNVSWHSIPNLLDSIDRHLCASKYEIGTFHIPSYEPKKPELETILCKLPQWNITQVYSYLSENLDLQNMISLVTQQGGHNSSISGLANNSSQVNQHESKTCITPFKFASRWLKIGQETVDEIMSKSSRDKLRKCLNLSRKGLTVYSQILRYIKLVNSLLASINDLTVGNSWHSVKKTWNSVSYLLLNQNHMTKLY